MKWLAKQCEAASRRAPEVVAIVEANIIVCNEGKRKIVNRMEEEQSCKFQADPLVEKVTFAIERKRKQCN